LKVDAPKLVVAHLSGDDPKAQSTSGARRGLENYMGIERFFYKRRLASGGTNLVEPVGLVAEAVAIAGQEKDVFCTAKRAQLVGSGGGKYRQPCAIPNLPARLLASQGDPSFDLAPHDRLESRLSLRDEQPWSKAQRPRR